MRVTQGMYSFLPDLTDAQIDAQVQYSLDRSEEHTSELQSR